MAMCIAMPHTNGTKVSYHVATVIYNLQYMTVASWDSNTR